MDKIGELENEFKPEQAVPKFEKADSRTRDFVARGGIITRKPPSHSKGYISSRDFNGPDYNEGRLKRKYPPVGMQIGEELELPLKTEQEMLRPATDSVWKQNEHLQAWSSSLHTATDTDKPSVVLPETNNHEGRVNIPPQNSTEEKQTRRERYFGQNRFGK